MIKELNSHYSFTNPATVHDEEALTALELAGRTTAKVNEVVRAQNTLAEQTLEHLENQDTTIEQRMDAQDKSIVDIRTKTVPQDVKAEVQRQIENGTFDEQIDESLNHLNERVNNLLGSVTEGSTTMDAQVIDMSVDFGGASHENAGESMRSADRQNHDNMVGASKILPDDFYVVKSLKSIKDELNITVGGHLDYKGRVATDTTGNEVTDFIKLADYPELWVSGCYQYSTAILCLYNVNKELLTSVWSEKEQGSEGYGDKNNWENKRFTLMDALAMDEGAVYVRFCSYTPDEYHIPLEIKAVDHENSVTMERYNKVVNDVSYGSINTVPDTFTDITGECNITNGGYLSYRGSLVNEGTMNATVTDFIRLIDYPDLYVSGHYKFSTAIFCLYDNNYQFLCGLSAQGTDDYSKDNVWSRHRFNILDALKLDERAVFVRFGSYQTGLPSGENASLVIETASRVPVDYATLESGNVLAGKKYVACGDSFTEGDFSGWVDENGLSGKNSPVIYDSQMGEYKTYPWWIAKRNNMKLVNEAKCGSIMALSKEHLADPTTYPETDRSPFSLSRYKAVPEDADYLTIWFGINDSGHTNLGTIEDTTNETFYGAFNVVMEWFLTNRPLMRIGLIVTTGATPAYRQAVRDIGVRWGVPVLDMMGEDTPTLFDKESGLCAKARELRRSTFYVTSTNGHPNVEAHEWMSTYIEAFLRRL